MVSDEIAVLSYDRDFIRKNRQAASLFDRMVVFHKWGYAIQLLLQKGDMGNEW
jgi:hypothetical protein